jgi:hypothetical protein
MSCRPYQKRSYWCCPLCATVFAPGVVSCATVAAGGDVGSRCEHSDGCFVSDGAGHGTPLHRRPSGLKPSHVVSPGDVRSHVVHLFGSWRSVGVSPELKPHKVHRTLGGASICSPRKLMNQALKASTRSFETCRPQTHHSGSAITLSQPERG